MNATLMNKEAAQKFDVVVLGAGAAGLMCALRAGQRGRKVLLLDRAEKAGPKILISGGGRCNFTNRHISTDCYISDNPHFCVSALKSYTQFDFIALVEKHKISYHEKTLGQLFCDNSAQEIVLMLLNECQANHVTVRLGQHIVDIRKSEIFQVQTADETIETTALVMATGGLSIPKLGATGLTFETARRFGLPVTETRPALVPLTFGGSELALMRGLAGVSLDVIASCGKQAFRESLVFTHRGLSGPSILQISSYVGEHQTFTLDLLPGRAVEALLSDRKKERCKAELQTILAELLPQRLAQSLTATYFSKSPIGSLTDKYLKEVARKLKQWTLTPEGSEGYAKAEVTLGGVDTKSLSSKTMEAKDVPGLYIIGEAVDVTGWLGGYNFQWAWSSGWAAGSAA